MTLNDIQEEVTNFLQRNLRFFERVDFVIGMSRGGLIPAAIIATKINKPLITAYIDKQDNIYFDRKEWINDKVVLVVDDIVRSGRTLFLLEKYLKENSTAKELLFYTIFSVSHLRDKQYTTVISSKEMKEDIILPWDYDRTEKIVIKKIEIPNLEQNKDDV